MMTEVYNQEAKKISEVELPDRLFNKPWNPELVHQVLLTQMANARARIAHAKNRGEVSGGGRKPWVQKGTGRARHGSIRSPLWKGGGVTHGPTKTRKYSMKINQKMKQGAIFSVLSKKLKEGEIKIIDSLNIKDGKTRTLNQFLTDFFNNKPNALLIPNLGNLNIYLASRNLPKVKALNPKTLNVYDLLKFKNILLDKEAVGVINEHFHATK